MAEVPKGIDPIWQSPNAEKYFSAPGLEGYVIWKYTPGAEGVKEFPRFDNLDPLPHHYYASQEEYEKAKTIHGNGGTPDQIINLNIPRWRFNSEIASGVIVEFPDQPEEPPAEITAERQVA